MIISEECCLKLGIRSWEFGVLLAESSESEQCVSAVGWRTIGKTLLN